MLNFATIMLAEDEKYMHRALQLARCGAYHASPNPMVGAVVVCDGLIVGEGYHRRCGEGHAEVNAVAGVANKALLLSSTVYVTLEPCSHYGKTPPCAKLLIDCGVRRVVVGAEDPFEQVSGRGIKMLRDAGIDVTVGVLEQECRQLNKRFFTAHTRRRPWVTLKWAQSADGFMAGEGGRVTFSTPITMRLMHRERAMADAIVVGAGTVLADNPSLTVRRWAGESPLRVVLDGQLSAPADAAVLTDGGKTLIYNAKKKLVEGGVELVRMDARDPDAWLGDLYNRGVTSVMVEGGATVLSRLISRGLWDEARVETAPTVLGSGLKAPTLSGCVISLNVVDGNEIKLMEPH